MQNRRNKKSPFRLGKVNRKKRDENNQITGDNNVDYVDSYTGDDPATLSQGTEIDDGYVLDTYADEEEHIEELEVVVENPNDPDDLPPVEYTQTAEEDEIIVNMEYIDEFEEYYDDSSDASYCFTEGDGCFAIDDSPTVEHQAVAEAIEKVRLAKTAGKWSIRWRENRGDWNVLNSNAAPDTLVIDVPFGTDKLLEYEANLKGNDPACVIRKIPSADENDLLLSVKRDGGTLKPVTVYGRPGQRRNGTEVTYQKGKRMVSVEKRGNGSNRSIYSVSYIRARLAIVIKI